MKKFFLDNRKPILTFLVVALVVYLIYRYGKSKGGYNPLPTDGGTGTAGQLTTADAQNVRHIAQELKQDIYGANVWSRDTTVYEDFSALSDTLFVAVCNDYKTLTGKSLHEDMQGEFYNWNSFALGGIVDAIYTRMNKLNIQ